MSQNSLEKFSHRSELRQVLNLFTEIEGKHPALKTAIFPIRQTIGLRLDPSYPRITMREQRDIMTEVCVILQASDDMTVFQGDKNVQKLIVEKANAIHPTFD